MLSDQPISLFTAKGTEVLRLQLSLAASCLLESAALLAAPTTAQGQCPFDWLPGQGVPGVVGGGGVHTIAEWDPDEAGPAPALLVVGGDFQVAGDIVAKNIVAWDGAEWQPLGSGMNGSVYALTVYNGELIAGGDFTTAGGASANDIARWNGSAWERWAAVGGSEVIRGRAGGPGRVVGWSDRRPDALRQPGGGETATHRPRPGRRLGMAAAVRRCLCGPQCAVQTGSAGPGSSRYSRSLT